MSFETLNISGKNFLPRYNKNGTSFGFKQKTGTTAHFPVGYPVKQSTTAGEVELCAATGDRCLGVVIAPAEQYLPPSLARITVLPFDSIAGGELVGEADGSVGLEGEVAVSGYNATTGLIKLKAAASGDYVVGHALRAQTTGNEINIMLSAPYFIP